MGVVMGTAEYICPSATFSGLIPNNFNWALKPLTLDVVEPETLPVLELWPYAQYLKQQGMVFVDIELAFWRKLLQPLATLGLVLVAMSFIFGPLREGTMGARIFVGVIVGVVFRISQDFFGPASLIFGYDPLVAALVPIAVCWLGGTWLLWRRA